MSTWSYTVKGDDVNRIATVYDTVGNVIEVRPYNDDENERLDAALQQEVALRNEDILRSGMQEEIDKALARQAEMQAIRDTPNADVRSNPAPSIQTLAKMGKQQERAIMRLARLVGNLTNSTDIGVAE